MGYCKVVFKYKIGSLIENYKNFKVGLEKKKGRIGKSKENVKKKLNNFFKFNSFVCFF